MPTIPPPIEAKADTAMQLVIDTIGAHQSTWMLTHDRYWQGIRIPPDIPVDGADTVPDKSRKPVNDPEAAAWAEVPVDVSETLPCAIEVFTHDGPSGKGYSVIGTADVGANRFRKAVGTGPDSITTSGWIEIEKAIPGHGPD